MSERSLQPPRTGRESILYLESLDTEATGMALAVEGVRQHPGKDGLSRERNALWRAICLDWVCEQGTEMSAEGPVFPLPAELATPEIRYETEAAVRMVPHLLPFEESERDFMRDGFPLRSSGDEISLRAPEEFGRWCEWLWEHDIPVSIPVEVSGRAADFLVAVTNLTKGLEAILMEEARIR